MTREANPMTTTSCRDRVRATLDRVEALNPALNAVLADTAALATSQATRVDEAEDAGDWLGLLHGVTVALKDNIDTAGLRTTSGSAILADHVPEANAHVVDRLLEAGAVPVVKTNLAEFAMGATTHNAHYGACRNAWDRTRVAGGSSGGSAVAVAAGLADVALGTDTGGSVLVPSALNGVTGLRPSQGRVSNRGVLPVSQHFDTVGPIARSAVDVARAFAALEGYDDADPTSERHQTFALPTAWHGVEGLRVGVPGNHFLPSHEPVATAVQQAIGELVLLGATSTPIQLAGADEAQPNMSVMMFADFAVVHDAHAAEWPDRFDPDVLRRLRIGQAATATDYAKARAWLFGWRRTLDRAFADVDVVVTPTVGVQAMPIDASDMVTSSPLLTRFTHPWCTSPGPTITVPCGIDDDGLPMAMQISAAKGREDLVLRAAVAYQSATSWHRARPDLTGATA